MSIISDSEFLTQQALLGSGYAHLTEIEILLETGFKRIVLSEDVDVEKGLLTPYYRNMDEIDPSRTSNLLRIATEALERHITSMSGQTFNDYLYVRGLKVSRSFASLSAKLGYIINPLNIE